MNPWDRLTSVLRKDSRVVIGLMSGMSMDGVDLAMVRIQGTFPELKIELLASARSPYTADFHARLLGARRNGTARDVCELAMVLSTIFADAVNAFLSENRVDSQSVDAIGSHGQTLVHNPQHGSGYPSTLQLGWPSVIAQRTGIPTIGNFRVRDMAVGGEGAPLIPLVDYLIYRREGRVRALNNLGSTSNVTVVTPSLNDLFAFDTGPANMPIDHISRRVTSDAEAFDKDGTLSASGQVDEALLNELLSLPFFSRKPPRSAGYEDFGPRVLDELYARHPACQGADAVRTAVEFSVESMARAYETYVLPRYPGLDEILLTGGGAYNETFFRRIRDRLPGLKIARLSDEDRRLNDVKEAVGFALLANETLSGRPGNVRPATGATEEVVLGELGI